MRRRSRARRPKRVHGLALRLCRSRHRAVSPRPAPSETMTTRRIRTQVTTAVLCMAAGPSAVRGPAASSAAPDPRAAALSSGHRRRNAAWQLRRGPRHPSPVTTGNARVSPDSSSWLPLVVICVTLCGLILAGGSCLVPPALDVLTAWSANLAAVLSFTGQWMAVHLSLLTGVGGAACISCLSWRTWRTWWQWSGSSRLVLTNAVDVAFPYETATMSTAVFDIRSSTNARRRAYHPPRTTQSHSYEPQQTQSHPPRPPDDAYHRNPPLPMRYDQGVLGRRERAPRSVLISRQRPGAVPLLVSPRGHPTPVRSGTWWSCSSLPWRFWMGGWPSCRVSRQATRGYLVAFTCHSRPCNFLDTRISG